MAARTNALQVLGLKRTLSLALQVNLELIDTEISYGHSQQFPGIFAAFLAKKQLQPGAKGRNGPACVKDRTAMAAVGI
ncbi:hypothetical protein [Actibacterium lipolyticum]|uniref:hypothetical protein n=1 Tax=Actibacterium lipolyticum TaxID=1524263 RepID=UPI0011324367|nr:hypothetical protein [Actibacterium lipolyticum]